MYLNVHYNSSFICLARYFQLIQDKFTRYNLFIYNEFKVEVIS